MRKLLTVILALLCLASIGQARKKAPKAGKITDGVYIDTKHDFSMTLPDGWKTKVQKAKSACRLVLTQEKFELPREMEPYRNQVPAPFAQVWLVELPFNTQEYIDSLMSDSYGSDLKSKILQDLHELNESMEFQGFVTIGRKGFKSGALHVSTWQGTADYKVALGTRKEKISIRCAYFGAKHGDTALIIIATGHRTGFKAIFDQITTMIKSMKWE